MILISACLAGFNCRYDGKNCYNPKVYQLFRKGEALPVCPEILGGLQTPRNAMEIVHLGENEFRVIDTQGNDCTDKLKSGAKEVLKIAMHNNIKEAILRSNSPSCGFGKIYDGTFSGQLVEGNGVAADLLSKNGIKIYNEQNCEIKNCR